MSSLRESSLVRGVAFALPLFLPVLVLRRLISSSNSDISFIIEKQDSEVEFASFLWKIVFGTTVG